MEGDSEIIAIIETCLAREDVGTAVSVQRPSLPIFGTECPRIQRLEILDLSPPSFLQEVLSVFDHLTSRGGGTQAPTPTVSIASKTTVDPRRLSEVYVQVPPQRAITYSDLCTIADISA
jgi:hypothetical protein